MNGVLGHDSALLRLDWVVHNLANEMNFLMNHALVQDGLVDLLASSPECYDCTNPTPNPTPTPYPTVLRIPAHILLYLVMITVSFPTR